MIAIPGENFTVSVWHVGAEKHLVSKYKNQVIRSQTRLVGHTSELNCMAFAHAPQHALLFSSSDRETLVWNIGEIIIDVCLTGRYAKLHTSHASQNPINIYVFQ